MNSRYPILNYPTSANDDVLLMHEITDSERSLLDAMNQAVHLLPKDTSLQQCHDAVTRVGYCHGLSRSQAIAFWTRTQFFIFEP
ncbi:hypothetical protein [Zooshikella sp. RANM57]|uniref:hypothetical protein n=1 Tax=Zooshikella sp. RANM57 TaxID=3425863 RepID=UPI003D6F1ADD